MSPLFATLLLLIRMMVTTPVRTARATRAPRVLPSTPGEVAGSPFAPPH